MPLIGPTAGLAVEATVKEIDFNRGTVRLVINLARSDVVDRVHDAPIPAAWTGAAGEFAGGYPAVGSTVLATQGQGGRWSILSYAPSNGVFGDRNTNSIRSFRQNRMSAFKPGRHLIQVKNNIRHITDPDIGFQFGDPDQFVHSDPARGIHSNTFDSNMAFTEAHRFIIGPVYRDINANATRNVSGSALSSHDYQNSLVKIGLDTRTRTGDSFTRNPAFNESREVVYEFENSFGFTNDSEEDSIYDGIEIPDSPNYFPRTSSRADTLSLSLIEPNQLIETIKGTVVDIYGNIVDLNRSIIPNGIIESLSLRENEGNESETFKSLREQSRKSIAYHFEINARKESAPSVGADLLDLFLDDSSDYSRLRSRFSFDIDKEGQFKMNVPSSSETGNVGLTVRNENYSAVAASTNDNDPREFVRNVDNQDVFVDSFGKGYVSISGSSDAGLEGFAAPTDRITGRPIKLGTVFHNIENTLILHSLDQPVPLYKPSKLNQIKPVASIVSPEIVVSGPNANAGGRSGTITLDGMLNMSIGANTVDRQSLWLDLQGGMVTNAGRDKNDVSWSGKFDGDIFVEIGGTTPSDDSRFSDLNNSYKPGVLDIRVHSGNNQHVLRIDESGLRVYSFGEVDIVSNGDMRFKSVAGDMFFDAEGIYFYANDRKTGRKVIRNPGRSIR